MILYWELPSYLSDIVCHRDMEFHFIGCIDFVGLVYFFLSACGCGGLLTDVSTPHSYFSLW